MFLEKLQGWLGFGDGRGRSTDSTELISQDYTMAQSFSGDDIMVSY